MPRKPLPPLSVLTRSAARYVSLVTDAQRDSPPDSSGGTEDMATNNETDGPPGLNTGGEELPPGVSAIIQSMQDQLTSMSHIVQAQQAQISQMLSERQGPERQTNFPSSQVTTAHMAPTQSARVPQIAAYSGSRDQQTSTKVKSFVFNVRKVGQMNKMSEASMVAFADCYLQDRAARWMMRLEDSNEKPSSMSELQDAMIKEFIPPDEKARAKKKLMTLKLLKTVEQYILSFRDLVDICGTPLSESYLFFFTGLPDEYKQEFTKKYPTAEPPDMLEVYEHARTLEMAQQWNSKRPGRASDKPSKADDKKGSRRQGKRDSPAETKNDRTKDKDSLLWGPAEPHERTLYRRSARCYDCGARYSPDHSCDDKEKGKKGSSTENSPKE